MMMHIFRSADASVSILIDSKGCHCFEVTMGFKLISCFVWTGALITFVGCDNASNTDRLERAPVEENEKALWIDVRTPSEFAEKTVGSSINIPFDQIVGEVAQLKLQKSDSIIVFCRSGRRSGIAKASLEGSGFTNITDLGSFADAQAYYDELN
ncbi:rhodanese-like domain-containing protein [Lentimonas sp. CC11]|uniref:rhodanese-like domain-containing protein n=2 Tax=Lentimonas TaxID=417293 RepID=UPI001389B69F|nr:rhodanese-like domain-containing protein [Lentimonas sp. CC11]